MVFNITLSRRLKKRDYNNYNIKKVTSFKDPEIIEFLNKASNMNSTEHNNDFKVKFKPTNFNEIDLKDKKEIEHIIYVLYRDNSVCSSRIVGYIYATIDKSNNDLAEKEFGIPNTQINEIFILPEFREKGYAKSLLRTACNYMRNRHNVNDIMVSIAKKNTKAIMMYQHFLFNHTDINLSDDIAIYIKSYDVRK